MGRKRKHAHMLDNRGEETFQSLKRRSCTPKDVASKSGQPLQHPVLLLHYAQVLTLRSYLLSRLPLSSRSRRKCLANLKTCDAFHSLLGLDRSNQSPANEEIDKINEKRVKAIVNILDTTVVGVTKSSILDFQRHMDFFNSFSQLCSSALSSSLGNGLVSQNELVDYTIWLLFHHYHTNSVMPPHLLCYGFQRANNINVCTEAHGAVGSVPGLVSSLPNMNAWTLKSQTWNDLRLLLGKDGDRIMLELLLDSGIFLPIAESDNLCQISGKPLDLISPQSLNRHVGNLESHKNSLMQNRKPSQVIFVRSRMLYARPTLNADGSMRLGMRHIHALNRYSNSEDSEHTNMLLKYIFPRQFGLHNVFTSLVNKRETTCTFKDYTLREEEISGCFGDESLKPGRGAQKLPERLTKVVHLICKLQKQHARCSYTQLLRHYSGENILMETIARSYDGRTRKGYCTHANCNSCKRESENPPAQESDRSLLDFATPPAHVSAFCRAVLARLIPRSMWGEGEDGQANFRSIMCHVDKFIRLRRFENANLHTFFQSIKLRSIEWLRPNNVGRNARLSQTDFQKRKDLFLEFVYYVVDSIVVPLIQANFYVTESNSHSNRLFYFRHDIWHAVTEPSLCRIKDSSFSPLTLQDTERILSTRTLGYSQMRLLPKKSGVRPIMNLKRRATTSINGRTVLKRSINSILGTTFSMLDYERHAQSHVFGSAIWSVSDIYPRLKQFKTRVMANKASQTKFYFAKVDVQSCFESIPQHQVIDAIEKLCLHYQYRITRHTEMKVDVYHDNREILRGTMRCSKMFAMAARPGTSAASFKEQLGTKLARMKHKTIFIEGMASTCHDRDDLLDLLEEHIERNVVRIGRRFYIQKEGIPQGSVVSTLLCNYFYAGFERECLSFLDPQQSLLLRLVDDFLLITTNRTQATTFLKIMHEGSDKYGITVNPEKTLINFHFEAHSKTFKKCQGPLGFPYCGTTIDDRTLEIARDRSRRLQTVLADSLTVETSSSPGRSFHRKILNTYKLQFHAMFMDTSLNSLAKVLTTLYQNSIEIAMKAHRYLKLLKSQVQIHPSILEHVITDLINLTYILIQSKKSKESATGFECSVTKSHIQYIVYRAFRWVLEVKQTGYSDTISWLDTMLSSQQVRQTQRCQLLRSVIQENNAIYYSYTF